MSFPEELLHGVARIFAALAEPTRLRIVGELRSGPLTVGELVERLDAKQANVSKQLGLLHAAGLLGRERHGIHVRYFVSEQVVVELCDAVCSKLERDAKVTLDASRLARKARPKR